MPVLTPSFLTRRTADLVGRYLAHRIAAAAGILVGIDGDANRSDRRLSVGQTEAEAARARRPAGELGIAGDAGVDQRLAGRRVDDEDAVAPPRQRRRIADILLGPVQRDRVSRLLLRLGDGAKIGTAHV